MDKSSEITVLFVDEDSDFLNLASRLLELETDRINLLPESCPHEALNRLDERVVDCIVSDYQMTKMDGLELLERVRERYPMIPFILFTGRGSEDIASEAIAAGATDYIIKTGSPDQYTVLANRIEKAVSRRRIKVKTTRQERINSVLRIILQKVISQTTREEIEHTVCEEFVSIEPYSFAQISTPVGERADIHPKTWAIDDATEIGSRPIIDVIGGDTRSPEQVVHETGESLVVEDIKKESRFDQWQSLFVDTSLSSLIGVPIEYAGISYGVLSLYTPQPDLFDGIERVVIEEIGTLIGFVIGRAELQKGMFSPTKTELGLSTRDPSARLIQLANSLKTTVTLEYAIPRAGDTFLMSLLFEEELDQEQTRATIEETLKPDKTKVTTTEDGDARWTVVSETCSIKVFIDRGIQLNHIIATPEQCHLYLEAPSNIDSRDIVELAESQFTEVELTEQRTDIERQQSTVSTSDIIADLTPRQLEVLETAYRNGFFQSPRAMGSEEIASLLGISQPAFSRHLRNVQQTVVEHLIEELATSHPLD